MLALNITTAMCAMSRFAAYNVTKSGNSWAQRKERDARARESRMGRRLDLDGDRRGYETVPDLLCWRPWKDSAYNFMCDAAKRIVGRPQITTDAHRPYLQAIEDAFGTEVDYAQLHKIFGAATPDESRYSPATCIGCDMKTVMGNPDPKHVSTSFVERQNLSMRMGIRRFTRLTNAFSKKVENHAAAVVIWFMYYNFVRVHSTLRVTPAMEAGISDHVWSIEEMCSLLPQAESSAKRIDKGIILKALE